MALITERRRSGAPGLLQGVAWAGATAQVAFLGALSIALYVFLLARPYSVFEYGATPLLNMSELTDRTVGGIFRYLATIGLPFLPYAVGFLVLARRRVPLALIIGVPAVAGIALLFVYPLTATDVLLYGSQVRVMTEYGANPYTTPLTDFPGDPLLGWADFADQPSAYGPLWTYIATVPTVIGGDEAMRVAIGMKALVLAALVASTVLTYRVAEDLRPGSGTVAAYLLGWNPVVLWSVAGDGHNDIVMALPVLLALYLLPRRPFFAPSAVVAAALVKVSALVFAPLLFIYLWRRGYDRKLLAGSALTAAALGAALFAPFWEGLATLEPMQEQVRRMVNMSPGATLILVGERLGLSREVASAMAKTAMYQAFAILYVVLLFRLRGRPESLARSMFWAAFLLIFFATFWFRFWYILWILPLAAVLVGVDRKLAVMGVVFSAGCALIYVYTDYTWVWLGLEFGLNTHRLVMLTVFLPPLLYWAAAWAVSKWRESGMAIWPSSWAKRHTAERRG